MRSDKGPWKDPEILKMVQNGEHKCTKRSGSPTAEEKTISEDGAALSRGSESFKVVAATPPAVAEAPRIPKEERSENAAMVQRVSFKHDDYRAIDKSASMHWKKVGGENLAIAKAADNYTRYGNANASDGFSSPLVTGVITFVMGIVTMIRVTRNMPKQLTNANIYSSPVYYDEREVKDQLVVAPTISDTDLMTVMKRMAELEEKVSMLSLKPVIMPPEKEELLNTAVTRVEALEEELASTKKALEDSQSHQTELVAYLEKKKKQKRMLFW